MSDQPSVEWFKNRCVWYQKALDVLVARIVTLEAQLASFSSVETEVRFTPRLRAMLLKAATGSLRSYVASHGPSLENSGLDGAAKRVTGALWGLLKTHPDVRNTTGERWRDEDCEAECQRKALRITELEAQCAALQARIAEMEQARDRTINYIETAMRPISILEACCETAWDRAQREGLRHGLNAIRAEFAKVTDGLTAPPSSPSQP